MKTKFRHFLVIVAFFASNWCCGQQIKLNHLTMSEYISTCMDSLYEKDSLNYSSMKSIRIQLYPSGRVKTARIGFLDKSKSLTEADCDWLYQMLDRANYFCLIEGLSQLEIERKLFTFQLGYQRAKRL